MIRILFNMGGRLTQNSSDTTFIDIIIEFINYSADGKSKITCSKAGQSFINVSSSSWHNWTIVKTVPVAESLPSIQQKLSKISRYAGSGLSRNTWTSHLPVCERCAVAFVVFLGKHDLLRQWCTFLCSIRRMFNRGRRSHNACKHKSNPKIWPEHFLVQTYLNFYAFESILILAAE